MHRIILVEPWPLWLAGAVLLLLGWGLRAAWSRRAPQSPADACASEWAEVLPWVAVGAGLASLAGGCFSLSLGWPLLDQWVGTRWWIKLPVLLTGGLSLGLGLRLLGGRITAAALAVALAIAIALVGLGGVVL